MTTTTEPLIDYTPRGAARELFSCRDPEVLIEGPAGTGKSLAALHKINAMALENPGMRALIVRKTAVSLSSSALVTFKRDVIPNLTEAEVVGWYGGSREEAAGYRYANGSRIDIGGMDKSSKIMSTDYDIIYVQEATELTKTDLEDLTTRLRNGVVSFQQLIADCNPAESSHWLLKRAQAGAMTRLYSRHHDNPILWDPDAEEWTTRGTEYMKRLDSLSGTRRRRLRDGEWASAEGIVYDEWDSAVHLIDHFEPPRDWPRYWVVDFGFTHPFVCQFWAEDPDGRLYMYREWYRTQMLVSEHAEKMLEYADFDADGELLVDYIICDHDAEGRAQLTKALARRTVAAKKDVRDGIQAVKERLKPARDGKPRLYLMRDALIERDPALTEAAKPACTAEEIGGYVWASNRAGIKEEPQKEDDHGCLVADTLVATETGPVPICDIRIGDRVWTRRGLRPVLDQMMTNPSAELVRVVTNQGSLVGTPDHPIWVEDLGWVPLDGLRYGMMVPCLDQSNTADVPTAENQTDPTTSEPPPTGRSTYTDASMRTKSGQSRTVTASTIETSTQPTMTPPTSKRSQTASINRSMSSTDERTVSTPRHQTRLASLPPSGTDRPKAESGTASMGAKYGGTADTEQRLVSSVELSIKPDLSMVMSGFARTTARAPGDEIQASITRIASVIAAGPPSPSIATKRSGSASARVLSVTPMPERAPVFNLTVEDEHEYYANGLLVSNCDCLRYLVAHRDPLGVKVASARFL